MNFKDKIKQREIFASGCRNLSGMLRISLAFKYRRSRSFSPQQRGLYSLAFFFYAQVLRTFSLQGS